MNLRLHLVVLAMPVCAFADVAMFHGDIRHTGVYDTSAPQGLQTVKWKFKTGGKILSSPVVYRESVFFGSADHNLYSVDAVKGTLKWKYETEGGVHSSPAVADGLVYFASIDGNFYAVDATTGKLKWKFATAGEQRFTAKGIHGLSPATETMPDPFDVFLSSPAVDQGTVYFGSGDHNVYALDAQSGQLKWKFKTGDVVHSSPAVADGLVYIGSWDRYFYALDARKGTVVWKFQTGDDPKYHNGVGIQGSPAVAGGLIYFGCRDANVYALDAKTGAEKWRFNNKGSWVNATPAIHDGKIYFSTSDSQRFHALNAANGHVIFSIDTKIPSFSSPAIVGNMAYFGTFDGKLRVIDLKAQKEQPPFQTEASKENAPKYLKPDGSLNAPAVYTDNTLDEAVLGNYRTMLLGSIFSSPVVANGILYVGSTDGNLYALN